MIMLDRVNLLWRAIITQVDFLKAWEVHNEQSQVQTPVNEI